MGTYTINLRQYRAILSKKMAYGALQELPVFADMIGFIGNKRNKPYPEATSWGRGEIKFAKPTGKPIEVLTNWNQEGGITMDIPVAYPLTDPPVYGDKQLLGSEEDQKMAWKTCVINQVRKATTIQTGNMSKLVLKKPEPQKELMTTAQAKLSEYFTHWNAYQPYETLCRRYSANITAAKVDGGMGDVFTPASHPNFYVANSGKVTWSDTPATYESNVAAALGALTDTAACHFNTSKIRAMTFTASSVLKIARTTVMGMLVYVIIVNTAQALQLWDDQEWVQAQKDAGLRGDKNKALTGMVQGIYQGALILADVNSPGAKVTGDTGYDSTRGTVNYGNANFIQTQYDTSNRKLAFLLGSGAVVAGYGSPLGFEKEDWDYGNKKSEGAHMVIGYERSDIYDYDGYFGTANRFKENTSSMIFASYSPSAAVWNGVAA